MPFSRSSGFEPDCRVSREERVVGQLKARGDVTVGQVAPIGTVDGVVLRRDERDGRVADITTDGTHRRVRYWQRDALQGVEVLEDQVEAANRAVAWLVDDTACCQECGSLYRFSMETLSVYCRRCRRRRVRDTVQSLSDQG